MPERPRLALVAAAVAAFALVASAYLPVGRALRYATLHGAWSVGLLLFLPFVLAAAFVHETLVRGLLYGALRRRLAPGLAAPSVAALSGFVPSAVRLGFLPHPRAPWPILFGQTYLVEALLGLGLCWLALGASSPMPAGAALFLVWLARLLVTVVSHGGVVPFLELLAAALAPLAVALVLRGPLRPHRDAVMEA